MRVCSCPQALGLSSPIDSALLDMALDASPSPTGRVPPFVRQAIAAGEPCQPPGGAGGGNPPGQKDGFVRRGLTWNFRALRDVSFSLSLFWGGWVGAGPHIPPPQVRHDMPCCKLSTAPPGRVWRCSPCIAVYHDTKSDARPRHGPNTSEAATFELAFELPSPSAGL